MKFEVMKMPDYRNISNRLIAALSEIIDQAQAALEAAEEDIISDEENSPILHVLPIKKEK